MKLNIMTKAQMEKYMDRLVRKLGDKINDEIYILRKRVENLEEANKVVNWRAK